MRATFMEEGKFGITFGSTQPSDPGPMKINRIDPSGLAAKQPQLKPGLVLIAVQGRSVRGKSQIFCADLLRRPPRPITMTFVTSEHMDAQPKATAAVAAREK